MGKLHPLLGIISRHNEESSADLQIQLHFFKFTPGEDNIKIDERRKFLSWKRNFLRHWLSQGKNAEKPLPKDHVLLHLFRTSEFEIVAGRRYPRPTKLSAVNLSVPNKIRRKLEGDLRQYGFKRSSIGQGFTAVDRAGVRSLRRNVTHVYTYFPDALDVEGKRLVDQLIGYSHGQKINTTRKTREVIEE
jgi:hypothetical protein